MICEPPAVKKPLNLPNKTPNLEHKREGCALSFHFQLCPHQEDCQIGVSCHFAVTAGRVIAGPFVLCPRLSHFRESIGLIN